MYEVTCELLVCVSGGAVAPPAAGRGRCFHVGRDSAAPPPPQPIWKRKKNFFVSKESTAAILSWLGISGYWF